MVQYVQNKHLPHGELQEIVPWKGRPQDDHVFLFGYIGGMQSEKENNAECYDGAEFHGLEVGELPLFKGD